MKRLGFWIFLLLTILWMTVIFYFSSKDADNSTENSHAVGMLVGRLFVPDFSELTEAEQLDFAGRVDKPVRKTAHACEYALLGFLVLETIISFGADAVLKHRKLSCLAAWLFATLYAVSDEVHQYFVPGRSCQFTDVCIDSAGALLGVLAAMLIIGLGNRRRRKSAERL